MKKKHIGLIALGVIAPVGIYFRKQISTKLNEWRPKKTERPLQPLDETALAAFSLYPSADNRLHAACSKEPSVVNGEELGHELILLRGYQPLYSRMLEIPHDIALANTGSMAVCHWNKQGGFEGEALALGPDGTTLIREKLKGSPQKCRISDEGSWCAFEIRDTGNHLALLIYDMRNGNRYSLDPPNGWDNFSFDAEKPVLLLNVQQAVFRYSVEGQWLNKEEFAGKIMNGDTPVPETVYYMKWLISAAPGYFYSMQGLIEKALNIPADPLTETEKRMLSFLIRKIGEHFEAEGQASQAIDAYNRALALNDKVGVKRKLQQLQNEG